MTNENNAATLRQQGWQCAVHEAMVERAVKAAYKHDTTERVHIDRETMAAALQAALAQHGHPEDWRETVRRMADALEKGEWADSLSTDPDLARLDAAINKAIQHGQPPSHIPSHAVKVGDETYAWQEPPHGQPNMQEMEAADILRVDADRLATAIQASQHGQQGEEQAVAFLNTKYQTLFHASEIGNTERNAALLASGELVRLYTRPAARAGVPDEDERDAARYRKLRTAQHGRSRVEIRLWDGDQLVYGHQLTAYGLDAAIDALAAAPSAESGEAEKSRQKSCTCMTLKQREYCLDRNVCSLAYTQSATTHQEPQA